MSEPSDPSSPSTPENVEWRLADFTDAVASEVDRAQDTLAFKSLTRGFSVSLKGLSLDLSVYVRMDGQGRVFFRTAEAGQTGASLLKLELEEVFREQIEEVRTPIDESGLGLPLSTLPQITEAEIRALQGVSANTVEDLRRSAQTPALLSALSLRTGIAENRLRLWLDLPYITRIVPDSGKPNQKVVVQGGNFGVRDAGDRVIFFPDLQAPIEEWGGTSITVRVPAGARPGPVYALLDGARTNVVTFRQETLDLRVTSLERTPASPIESTPITFRAVVENRGAAASGPFVVQWSVDDQPARSTEAALAPGASRTLEIQRRLSRGPHRVHFTLDPDGDLPLEDRGAADRQQAFDVAGVIPPAILELAGISPATGTAGATFDAILGGRGFQDGIAVSFGAQITVESVRVEAPAKAVARLAIAAAAAPGPRDVTVTAPDGTAATLRSGFTVATPGGPPQIEAVVPAGATAGTSLEVGIRGRGFQPGATVSFTRGIVVRQARVVVSTGEIRATLELPAGGRRTANVTVVNPGGAQATLEKAFHIFAPGDEAGEGGTGPGGSPLSSAASVKKTARKGDPKK